jgi:hypothetical protein
VVTLLPAAPHRHVSQCREVPQPAETLRQDQQRQQVFIRPGHAPREWAIMAGENERATTTVRDLTGHQPRTIEEFLHENRELFR